MASLSSLRLWNTLTRREETFLPLEPGKVRMYTCGPTVYSRPHIGNYASFLMADQLRRWLEVSGYAVKHVKNITDVGHMVADQDEGEDKIEKQARAENADPLHLARKYEEQYLEDERALGLLEPFARPRATETIPEMIALTQTLMSKNHAYETEDGVYFAVGSFPGYGLLSGNTLDKLGKLEKGVRIARSRSKHHSADFALWKKRVGEHAGHILHWDSPWGDGFPGWHVECSAMSTKFLGAELDIHTGGEDNIFPHHECERAQSEAANGRTFVRYWVHKRRLNFADPKRGKIENEKMSKSLGNILTLPDIVARGFHPLDLRYFLLSAHYRSHTTFSWKGLEDAKKARWKILEWMRNIECFYHAMHGAPGGRQQYAGSLPDMQQRFIAMMDADLNTPAALAAVFDAIAWTYRQQEGDVAFPDDVVLSLWDFIAMIRQTFGCFEEKAFAIPEEIRKLVAERENARRVGDYTRSDILRKEALNLGYVLEDLKGGTKAVPRERRTS